MAVIALAADYHTIVFVIYAVDVFLRRHKFGHHKERELGVGDLDHLGHELDFPSLVASI